MSLETSRLVLHEGRQSGHVMTFGLSDIVCIVAICKLPDSQLSLVLSRAFLLSGERKGSTYIRVGSNLLT